MERRRQAKTLVDEQEDEAQGLLDVQGFLDEQLQEMANTRIYFFTLSIFGQICLEKTNSLTGK